MSTSQPKVSILSSSYNHVDYLEAFIESVFAQTYTNFELLMLDDGSKDGSGDLLMKLSQEHDFKAFIRENKGFPNALNTLRKQATGDYIVIIASDDLMTPDRLEKQVHCLENHPKVALVCGDMQEIDEHNTLGNVISNPLSSTNQFQHILCSKTYILAPTVMIRKSCLDQVGNYDENLKVEDFDMWLRLAQKFNFLYVNACFAYYRIHSGNSHGNHKVLFEQKEKVLAKYADTDLGQQALQEHYLHAFLSLSRLKAYQDLAKQYKSKVKFQCSKSYLSAHLKYYFFPKH